MHRSCLLFAIAAQLSFAGPAGGPFHSSPVRMPIENLRFEPNTGQMDSQFQYFARSSTFLLGLSESGSELFAGSTHLRAHLIGARPGVAPEPLDTLPSVTNYLVGARENWRMGVQNFGRVRYRNIYHGIDLVFYGNGSTLEYDFLVSPGADPKVINFDLTGISSSRRESRARIDSNGALVIPTASGDIRWRAPQIYQNSGDQARKIEGGFIERGGHIGFRIGAYDPSIPLVIDPVLTLSTYFGGAGGDGLRGIAVDKAGNTYIAGSAMSQGLGTSGAAQSSFGGSAGLLVPIGDAFVAKLNPAGALVYFTYIGGSAEDAAGAIAVDSTGAAYIAGFTDSRDFPVSKTAAQTQFGGTGGNAAFNLGDAFVAKLSPAGDQLVYSTLLGGSLDDYADAIAIDASGNAYVTGGTQSTNFPVTAGAVQKTYGGRGGQPGFPRLGGQPIFTSGDAFVAAVSPNGSKFNFVTYLGGSYDDTPFAIALDSSLNIVVAGQTISTDFPTTPGAYQTAYAGADLNNNVFFNLGDGFVSKIKHDGSALIFSSYFGGRGDDGISSMVLDSTGAIYVAGATDTQNLPTTSSAFQKRYAGPFSLPYVFDQLIGDAFVAKLDPTGSNLLFLTYLGGSSDDAAFAMALDPSGNIAVAGITQSTDFPISADASQKVMAGAVLNTDDPNAGTTSEPQGGGGDAFLAVLDPGGTRLMYGTYLGGLGNDAALGIAIDPSGNFYLAGITQSQDFPNVGKTLQAAYGGGESDIFLARYSALPSNTLNAVTNAANNLPATAPGVAVPGMIFVGYGAQIGPATLAYGGVDAQGNRVTSVQGEQILFDGVPAPIYYVSANQVAGWVPYSVAGKTSTQVTVQFNGQTSEPLAVPVATADPGVFSANFSGSGPAAALNEDGSINSSSAPAGADSTVILFGTGEGQTNPPGVTGQTVSAPFPAFSLSVSATIGGLAAKVSYAGPAPGQTEGFSQWNLVVPNGLAAGNQPVVLTVGTFKSQANLTIAVH
jgi:uncharacterized protein (TIGR03437 family)